MNKRVFPWLFLSALALTAPVGAADVEISRRWATSPPVVDGAISAGEWTGAQVTPLIHGQLRTMNDASYLYILIDVTADTVNDVTHGSGPADYFSLAFDADLSIGTTPNVDLAYGACSDTRDFVKSYYLGGSTFTGCQNTNPATLGVPGFGPTPGATFPHRFWEFRLLFSEIGVDPGSWTTSSGEIPHVRVNVGTASANPSFISAQPDPEFYPSLANAVFQLDLATIPAFPPGSAGPTFFGVGLVPSTYIDSLGYANINIPGYSYVAKAAPFGGNLNVFGNWFLVLGGATKYRVMASKNGGPAQPVVQTWTNFKFNNVTGAWDPVAFAPDSSGRYPFVNPFQTWYLPYLLISWQTGSFGDGTYVLSLELFDAANNPLPAPPGNSLTLFVDNTPPIPTINHIAYDGTNACACAIVTQGDAPRGFTFDVSYTDANGALDGVSLAGIFGQNQSTGSIFSDSYANHVNEDGTHRWNGETNVVVPMPTPFRAGSSCAYSFILSASSRTQNGYSRLFSGVQYTTSLTILLGTGPGSISGCSGGSLTGRLSLNPGPMSLAGPGLRDSLGKAFAGDDLPAQESGTLAGLKQ
jgi:hypothetical protein